MEVKKDNYKVISTVRLTVAEGKRLIARGLHNNKEVRAALEGGMIIITRGSTNTYIAEEFAGLDAPHGALVTGKIIPASSKDFAEDIEMISEIVIIEGQVVDMSFDEALERAGEGDIIFKGANIINYSMGQAGVCIGAPHGGTVARITPATVPGKARWITPVGLEKDCSAELFAYSAMIERAEDRGESTRLEVSESTKIYTEIEAIEELADVDVYLSAKGGLAGAEGGISLLVCGEGDQVAKALEAVEAVIGEAAFV